MAEVFSGQVVVLNGAGEQTINVDGDQARVLVGGGTAHGELIIADSRGHQILSASAERRELAMGPNLPNQRRIRLDANEGDIAVTRRINGVERDVLRFDASHAALHVGAEGNEGDIVVNDGKGRRVLHFDAHYAALHVGAEGNEGDIFVTDGGGRQVFHFDSNYAALYIGAEGNEGDIIVRNGAGDVTVRIDGAQGDIVVRRRIGGVQRDVLRFDASHAALYVGAEGNEGDIIVQDGGGRNVFHFDSKYAALHVGAEGNEGDIIVRDGTGANRIHLDGNSGDIKLTGADCAEEVETAGDVAPGTVLSIDEHGSFKVSDVAYDRLVAGVVSGAGGLQPGLVLGHDGRRSGRSRLALTGRVECLVDGTVHSVAVGDLLTTADRPGHAMKAVDRDRAAGAVIGKSLGATDGVGLVPMLVTLQ